MRHKLHARFSQLQSLEDEGVFLGHHMMLSKEDVSHGITSRVRCQIEGFRK